MVKTKTELLVGHITTNADQEPKQVNNATVPNKQTAKNEPPDDMVSIFPHHEEQICSNPRCKV